MEFDIFNDEGVVVNRIVAEFEFVESHFPGHYKEVGVQPTPLPIKDYTDAVQIHLDSTVKTRNYDGILSACSYTGSSVPKFAAEAQACVLWRDSVWTTCYAILAEVQSGKRPAPTSAELLDMLPAMNWPEVQ